MPPKMMPRRFQPSNWQDATAATIGRLQQLKALTVGNGDSWHDTLTLAHQIVQSQGKTTNASEYWNTMVNTVRIIVVSGLPDMDPADSFDR